MTDNQIYKFSAPIEISGIITRVFCQKANGWCSFLLKPDSNHQKHTNINCGMKRSGMIQCTGNINININTDMHVRIKLTERETSIQYGTSFKMIGDSLYPVCDNAETVKIFLENANDLSDDNQPVITGQQALKLWKYTGCDNDIVTCIRNTDTKKLAQFCAKPDLLRKFIIRFDMISALMSIHECMTMQAAKKAYKKYGDNAYEHIIEYPYDLAIDLNFDMHKTDWIACDLKNMYFNDTRRKDAMLVYAVSKLCFDHQGSYIILNEQSMRDMLEIINTYYSRYKDKTMNICYLIGYDDDFRQWVRKTIDSDDRLYLTREGVYSLVYIHKLYNYETESAGMIADKINNDCIYDESKIQKYMSDININNKNSAGYEYDDEQKQAVMNVFRHKISVITGGAGAGKSSLIKPIIQMAEKFGMNNIYIMTPTHKAKNRVKTLIGKKYAETCSLNTLASELFMSFGEITKIDENTGEKKIEELVEFIPAELVIIDESSMVCLEDLYKLLCVTSDVKHIVFIGDYNQLPSIGAGCCFEDLCRMSKYNLAVTYLTGNYRADGRTIAENSKAINSGNANLAWNKEFVFYEKTNDDFAYDIACQFDAMIKSGIDIKDICCLAPVKDIKYKAGTEYINNMIQEKLNPYLHPVNASSPFITNGTVEFNIKYHKGWCFFQNSSGTKQFRIGDRVVCVSNDADDDKIITNGNTGTVTAFDYPDEKNGDTSKNAKVIIDFDDFGEKEIRLGKFTENFQLAYCITIHKAQGSEYNHVILAITNNCWLAGLMINRNLIYTAVTRAQKSISIYGSWLNMYNAIVSPPIQRASLLSYRAGRKII